MVTDKRQYGGGCTLCCPLGDGSSNGRKASILGHPGSSVTLVAGKSGAGTSSKQHFHSASITQPCCMHQRRHATLTLTVMQAWYHLQWEHVGVLYCKVSQSDMCISTILHLLTFTKFYEMVKEVAWHGSWGTAVVMAKLLTQQQSMSACLSMCLWYLFLAAVPWKWLRQIFIHSSLHPLLFSFNS